MTPTAADQLAQISRGFDDPVHATQQVFRGALAALSHPGRIQTVPDAVLHGLQAPGPQAALWSLMLTLVDGDAALALHPGLDGRGAAAWLQFHTGVRLVPDPANADFVALACSQAEASLWTRLNSGSDEAPQEGATLLIEVDGLDNSEGRGSFQLVGPGIAKGQPLRVQGLDANFWAERQALQSSYPRGIDLLLCCGPCFVGVPRTTRIGPVA